MRPQALVVVGGSAGGLEALMTVVADLPADLPAPVVVVLHMAPGAPSMLAQILGRRGRLPTRQAQQGDALAPGTVYTARPGFHLRVTGGHLTLDLADPLSGNRPSIDVLFESAAASAGSSAIGVLLSGNLRDGTAGLAAIVAAGGAAIVENPADAAHSAMPQSAVAAVPAARVVGVGAIARAIVDAVTEVDDRTGGATAADRA